MVLPARLVLASYGERIRTSRNGKTRQSSPKIQMGDAARAGRVYRHSSTLAELPLQSHELLHTMTGTACTDPKPNQSETLAQLCAELATENWFDEPSRIRTSRGEFELKLEIDPYYWSEHQISRRKFIVSGKVSLGSWCLNIMFNTPSAVGSPPWWCESESPAVRAPSLYALRFSELERTLNALDWSSRPAGVVIDGVDWSCRYSYRPEMVLLHIHLNDQCDVFGSLTLSRSSKRPPLTAVPPG